MSAARERYGLGPRTVESRERVPLVEGSLRVAVVADTHSRPHPALDARLTEIAPQHILHAGDIGALAVLDGLRAHAPVTAVRGNIDARMKDLPDVVVVEVCEGERVLVRALLTHVAVDRTRLRGDVARLARERGAGLVVCGHSHVPFMVSDGGVTLFNPGSVGPRRFGLPIVLGVMEVSEKGVSLRHVDCETGQRWAPRSAP